MMEMEMEMGMDASLYLTAGFAAVKTCLDLFPFEPRRVFLQKFAQRCAALSRLLGRWNAAILS